MSNRVRSITRVLVFGLGLAACQSVPDPKTAPIGALASTVLPRAPSAPGVDAPELARLFDELSVDRHLLVFQGGRHDVGNNPAPPDFVGPFSALESFAEPIWRTDRINAINQHFVTAFLDLKLKGDTSKEAFLNVPTQQSTDGVWKGPSANGVSAGDAQPGYWRGFQPRWALGLEMHHRAAEKAWPSDIAL